MCSINDFLSSCRLCLNPEIGLSIHSPCNEFSDSPTFSAIAICLANIQIEIEDSLPQFLCEDCAIKLKTFYEFKLSCETIYLQLLNYNKHKQENLEKSLQSVKDITDQRTNVSSTTIYEEIFVYSPDDNTTEEDTEENEVLKETEAGEQFQLIAENYLQTVIEDKITEIPTEKIEFKAVKRQCLENPVQILNEKSQNSADYEYIKYLKDPLMVSNDQQIVKQEKISPRSDILIKARQRMATIRASETPEQKTIRLEKQRCRQRAHRASETTDKKNRRLEWQRMYQAKTRTQESNEQTKLRLEKLQKYRTNEALTERLERRCCDKHIRLQWPVVEVTADETLLSSTFQKRLTKKNTQKSDKSMES